MNWSTRHKTIGTPRSGANQPSGQATKGRGSPHRPRVLVLGGGPDAEREVSLISSQAVADALSEQGTTHVERVVIDRLTIDELNALPADVIFPVLHGGWGEGGPLQDLLEADGRPFVGSMGRAARTAMDKVCTKLHAAMIGIPTPEAVVMDRRDPACPLPLPVVIKPIHEGSTIGLYLCHNEHDWAKARQQLDAELLLSDGTPPGIAARICMVEAMVGGASGFGPITGGPNSDGQSVVGSVRELTVGILDGEALPVIEIRPADGLYDYQAKYTREDTRYLLDPPLPQGVRERVQDQTLRLAQRMGIRHVARADFLLDGDGTAWFLEINTMPGFTGHSLVPMAAAHAGMPMPQLCRRLIDLALRDHIWSE